LEKRLKLKKRWILLITLLVTVCTLLLCKNAILKAIGWYLVAEDPLVETTHFVVLGGNSQERGRAACMVHQHFPKAKFICTGGNEPSQLAAIGIHTFEATLTKEKLINCGVNPLLVEAIDQGTSSQEEAAIIKSYCLEHGLESITIISGQYHLRRLRMTYDEVFSDTPIQVYFHAAIEKDFNPDTWWHSESGLIYTNNEYLKILYYWIKY